MASLIPIPGLKLFDEILAGLPVNAVLRLKLEELRAQMAVLLRENEDLKKQLKKYQEKPEFLAASIKVLKLIYDRPGELTEDDLQEIMGCKPEETRYHLGVLWERSFISEPGGNLDSPPGYSVTQDGRAYVMEHGLG